MREMPMGRFIPGNSPVHQLDARVKIIGLFALLAAIIAANTLYSYLFIICVLCIIFFYAGLPLGAALGSIRRMWLFLLIIFFMNALFFSSTAPLWSWWIFTLSQAGLKQGMNVVWHVLLAVVLCNMLTCTTAPMRITGALERLLKPLKLIRIPIEDVAMIISVAIQFIPILMEETDMIRKAQTARGARFESKKLTEKALCITPLIVPVFLSAFRRADELSQAMEARGYRGARYRTKKKSEPLQFGDYVALVICIVVCMSQFLILRYTDMH